MSAICGIYNLDGRPVAGSAIESMVGSLAHRGGDGAGVWCEGPVALGHMMLWTTPESLTERLPLALETAKLCITGDVRLDNREELIASLHLGDRPPEEIADSELVLAAYEKWNERCPEKLLGDFAFAIWDSRRRILFCARDHFGVRPFYYYSSGELFSFATEIKALFSLPEVPRRLNETMVAEFLSLGDEDATGTGYKDILRLAPAHSLTLSRSGIRLQTYWSLDPAREIKLNSDGEYADQFREIFTEAVRCRTRTAFPIGSTLSGGLDSSAITCVARNLAGQNGGTAWPTFSAVFDKVTVSDERQFQNAVLDQGGIDPHYFHADQVSPFAEVDRFLWHHDQLFQGGNSYIIWGLCKLAKEKGVRVLLEGFDGDTVVSHGTGYFRELAHERRWLALAGELRGFTRNMTGESWEKALWVWMWRHYLGPNIFKFRLSRLGRRGYRGIRQRSPFAKQTGDGFLKASFFQRTDIVERRTPHHKKSPQTEREDHYRKLTWAVTPHTLEMSGAMGSAFSVELRFPFYDRRLAEYCLALPPQQKMLHGLTRMVMRRAMTDILPPAVQWRPGKSDLYPSFEQGLLGFERKRLKDMMQNDVGLLADYINVNVLREAYQRYEVSKATPADVVAVWNSAVLTRWLQTTNLVP